jgi:hypothetical protein
MGNELSQFRFQVSYQIFGRGLFEFHRWSFLILPILVLANQYVADTFPGYDFIKL